MTPYVQALNPATVGLTNQEHQAMDSLVQKFGSHAIRLVSINHLQNGLNGGTATSSISKNFVVER